MHKGDITRILKTWNLWDKEIDYGIMRCVEYYDGQNISAIRKMLKVRLKLKI